MLDSLSHKKAGKNIVTLVDEEYSLTKKGSE